MPISFETLRRGTQWLIIKLEARGWLEEQEENLLQGEDVDRPNTKWSYEDNLMVEIKIIEDPQAPLHVGARGLPD